MTGICNRMARIAAGGLGALAIAWYTLVGGADFARADVELSRHFALSKSIPAADTVIAASPPELRLFFTEAPAPEGRSIRLTRGESDIVPTSAVEADAQDARQLVVRPNAQLAAGSYMIHWRALATDGHAQNGTISFTVSAD